LNKPAKILEKYGLKKTKNRLDVLQLFLENNTALCHADISAFFKNKMDRVTLYRVLQSFENKHIIHQFNDWEGIQRYALCSSHCSIHHHHQDEHAHLLCVKCQKTFCVAWEINTQNTITDFAVEEIQINVKGICKDCKNK
jgi:Fur family ferric uptake transcriptional regulator